MAVSRRLRFEVLRRDGHACRYCGRTAPEVQLTVDHVVPVALGGSDDPTNLVAACSDCNGGKSASNPDAAVVANVADDALRWAAAIRESAETMLADLAHRETQRREFRREWDGWTFGSKKMRIPLPDTWERSVDNFLAAGLPMPLLIDALRKAMRAEKVDTDQTFRYMCGIAWKTIQEIQDGARAAVHLAPAPHAAAVSAVDLANLLWGVFSYDVNTEQIAEWALQFREYHADDEDSGVDFATWPDEVCAFAQAVTDATDEMPAWRLAELMIRHLPESEGQHWMSEARKVCAQTGEPVDAGDVLRLAATMAFKHYRQLVASVVGGSSEGGTTHGP